MLRRSHVEVAIDILKKCRKPIHFSHLMSEVRLSFTQTKKYTQKLEQAGYIEARRCGREIIYEITQKGMEALEAFKPGLEVIEALKE